MGLGLNPERLRIEFMSGAEGSLLAEVTDDFTDAIQALGPLGKGSGSSGDTLKLKLDAARKLVPYLKLVERERLRAPEKEENGYYAFFESAATNRLLDDIQLQLLPYKGRKADKAKIGKKIRLENLLARARPRAIPAKKTRRQFQSSDIQSRHSRYADNKTMAVPPTSVVVYRPWAIIFGSNKRKIITNSAANRLQSSRENR